MPVKTYNIRTVGGNGCCNARLKTLLDLERRFEPCKMKSASGSNSVVESQPSKLLVAGPIPVSRSRNNLTF